MHRRLDRVVCGVLITDDVTEVDPPEGVHTALLLERVILEVPSDEPVEVRLARADRSSEEFDSFLGAETPCAGFDFIDELVDRLVDFAAVKHVFPVV